MEAADAAPSSTPLRVPLGAAGARTLSSPTSSRGSCAVAAPDVLLLGAISLQNELERAIEGEHLGILGEPSGGGGAQLLAGLDHPEKRVRKVFRRRARSDGAVYALSNELARRVLRPLDDDARGAVCCRFDDDQPVALALRGGCEASSSGQRLRHLLLGSRPGQVDARLELEPSYERLDTSALRAVPVDGETQLRAALTGTGEAANQCVQSLL